MSQEREQAIAMINQVRARLTDLESVIKQYEGDLAGYADKIDRIDDKVYLLESELERKLLDARKNAEQASESDPLSEGDREKAESSFASPDGDKKKELSPAEKKESEDSDDDSQGIKEEAKETVSMLTDIYVESKETLADFKEVFDDIKESPLMNNPLVEDIVKAQKAGKFRRRRW